MNFIAKEKVVNPEENAGFLSKLFFHWTLPLFRKGSKSELTVNKSQFLDYQLIYCSEFQLRGNCTDNVN